MTEQGQQMLTRIMRIGCQLSAESLVTDLQTSCDLQIILRTVHRELYGMGFHGQAAASKPYISKWMQWCKARRHWTLEKWRRVLWSDELHFSIWQTEGQVWWVWRLPGELPTNNQEVLV